MGVSEVPIFRDYGSFFDVGLPGDLGIWSAVAERHRRDVDGVMTGIIEQRRQTGG